MLEIVNHKLWFHNGFVSKRSLGQTKLRYHWHVPFSAGLLVANRLDHTPHLGSADKEGSGTVEGRHDQEMVSGISL